MGGVKPQIELRTIPRQQRLDELGNPTAEIETFPNRVVIRVLRQKNYLGSFHDLESEAMNWVPEWRKTFKVGKIKKIVISYSNFLCKTFTPELVKVSGDSQQINFGAALVMFADAPGKYKNLIPPFLAETAIEVDSERSFGFRVKAVDDGKKEGAPHEPGILVILKHTFTPVNKPLENHDLQSKLQEAHDLLMEQFEAFFTENAKKQFL
jgi:hypothetical protein